MAGAAAGGRERERANMCVREREGKNGSEREMARESRLFFLETNKVVRFAMQLSTLKP